MGKAAMEIIEQFQKEKLVSFDQIKKLYKDRSIKGVDFFTKKPGFIIKKVYLKNGENILFKH